jgi:6-phosphogluconolactonase
MVEVFRDATILSAVVASRIADLAGRKTQRGRRFTMALGGGATPRKLYRLLSTKPYCRTICWSKVHIFWIDERCVGPQHAKSNFRMVHRLLLVKLPIPKRNIHRVFTERGSPKHIAADYAHRLRRFFRLPPGKPPKFDLVLLGVGVDGHVASLFPKSQALFERRRLVAEVPEAPDLPRVTLTLPVLTHAQRIICMAAGAAKAPILGKILRRDRAARQLPAQLVASSSSAITWCLDRAAAAQLTGRHMSERLVLDVETQKECAEVEGRRPHRRPLGALNAHQTYGRPLVGLL